MAEEKEITPNANGVDEPKDWVTMIIICWLLGCFGIHRMMMGYSNWWLQLITLGGCGIWTLIDLFQIITKKMGMADGRPLKVNS